MPRTHTLFRLQTSRDKFTGYAYEYSIYTTVQSKSSVQILIHGGPCTAPTCRSLLTWRAPRAGAASVILSSGAQLVCVRQAQDGQPQLHGPRGRRQVNVLPRGAAAQGQAAERNLHAERGEMGHGLSDSDESDDEKELVKNSCSKQEGTR